MLDQCQIRLGRLSSPEPAVTENSPHTDNTSPPSALRRFASLGLRATIAAGIVAAAFLPSPPSAGTAAPASDAVPRVRVATVATIAESATSTLLGHVEPAEQRVAAFTIGGRLDDVAVSEGDVVASGDRIATLDCRGLVNGQRAADADRQRRDAELAQARADLDRAERLASAGATVGEEVEQRRAAVEMLEAALDATTAAADEARRNRGECALVAPVAGVVRAVLVEAGATVAPGTPIVQIDGGDAAEVVAMVPEAWAGLVAAGVEVDVDFPLLGTRARATVASVVRSGRGGLQLTRFTLPADTAVPAGATARIAVPREPARGVIGVPAEAIVAPAGS